MRVEDEKLPAINGTASRAGQTGSECRAGHNPFACYTLKVSLCQLALQPFPLSFPFRLIPLS